MHALIHSHTCTHVRAHTHVRTHSFPIDRSLGKPALGVGWWEIQAEISSGRQAEIRGRNSGERSGLEIWIPGLSA